VLSRKVKYLSHLAKHKGGSVAIVLAIVGAKQAPCFGRRQMLVHAGSPRALGVHGFSGKTLEEERLSYFTRPKSCPKCQGILKRGLPGAPHLGKDEY